MIGMLIVVLNVLHLQNFYLWKKDKKALRDIKDKDKEILIQVTSADSNKPQLFKVTHFHPIFPSTGELLWDLCDRARSRGSALPQRRRQEILETAPFPAEGLRNLLRAQREDQGQGSKHNIIYKLLMHKQLGVNQRYVQSDSRKETNLLGKKS